MLRVQIRDRSVNKGINAAKQMVLQKRCQSLTLMID